MRSTWYVSSGSYSLRYCSSFTSPTPCEDDPNVSAVSRFDRHARTRRAVSGRKRGCRLAHGVSGRELERKRAAACESLLRCSRKEGRRALALVGADTYAGVRGCACLPSCARL
eukprot:4557564-Pleurochrysis_carterae.AAC.1